MKLNFYEIFSNEEVEDYNLFLDKLRNLNEKGTSTTDILFLIYQYFIKYVKYNYDQVQIIKMLRLEKNEPGYKCAETYKKINDRFNEMNNFSAQTQLDPDDIIKYVPNIEQPYTEKKALELMNEAFLQVEGRKLTSKNMENIFFGYGDKISIPHKKAKIIGNVKIDEVLEHFEKQGLNAKNYKPEFCNKMIVKGVSSDYTEFLKEICKELGIKHIEIEGIESTIHSWSLIYLPEEQRWVHFDMAMVIFYKDGWVKNHEPYNMEDWVAASTSDIFKMQPERTITKINGINCSYNKDNYTNIDFEKFDKEEARE